MSRSSGRGPPAARTPEGQPPRSPSTGRPTGVVRTEAEETAKTDGRCMREPPPPRGPPTSPTEPRPRRRIGDLRDPDTPHKPRGSGRLRRWKRPRPEDAIVRNPSNSERRGTQSGLRQWPQDAHAPSGRNPPGASRKVASA